MIELVPMGDRAFLARFATEREAGRWGRSIRQSNLPGLVDVSLAYRTVGIYLDPDRVDLDDTERAIRAFRIERPDRETSREIEIPVLYDGEDLQASADALNLTTEQLIELHTSKPYEVFAIGFLPGFPYAGYLPAELSGLSRLANPRPKVPKGSVAIVGRQTAIYPGESPGGWRLIGRTPLVIVDAAANFFPIEPNDTLRFRSIGIEEFHARARERR